MDDPIEGVFWFLILAGLLFAGLWTYWQYQATVAYFPDMGFWEWWVLKDTLRIIPP